MTAFRVPCIADGQPFWTQRTQLDGQDFVLRFVWNQRDGHFSVDIADQDSVPITSGRVVAVGMDLLRGVVDARRPPGHLVVVDTLDQNDVDPGFADLGTRFVLVYIAS